MNSSRSFRARTEGVKESTCVYIDHTGRKVTWDDLKADARRGFAHFWEKRGGPPATPDFLFGKASS